MKGSVKDMNVEQIVELIQAVSASSIGELNYEEGNLKISLKKEENKTVLQVQNPFPVLCQNQWLFRKQKRNFLQQMKK